MALGRDVPFKLGQTEASTYAFGNSASSAYREVPHSYVLGMGQVGVEFTLKHSRIRPMTAYINNTRNASQK